MIDTITILLDESSFRIIDFDQFMPPVQPEDLTKPVSFRKHINNPTANDRKAGIYKPCVTLIRRGAVNTLKVQFSAPKLMFGNNVEELEEPDLDRIGTVLSARLLSMGAEVAKDNLLKATVHSFDPSKNIILEDGLTASAILKELSKVDVNKHLDVTKAKFRNGGQALYIHSNSNSFVAYDKVADLAKSPKRAVDLNQWPQDKEVTKAFREKEDPTEILRLEVRLSDKRKMNQVLKDAGYPEGPSLRSVINRKLCQDVLIYYWRRFFHGQNRFIFEGGTEAQTTLQAIIANHPKLGLRRAFELTALALLGKDEHGMKGLRMIVDGRKNGQKHWQKVKKDTQMINALNPAHSYYNSVYEALQAFKPLKLADLMTKNNE